MAVHERTIEDIDRELAAAEGELNATPPALLQRRIDALKAEQAAARSRDDAAAAERQQRESARRLAQLRALLDALKAERAAAVREAQVHRTVEHVTRAFTLDGQIVALVSDLAGVIGAPSASLLGVSTVKDALADLRPVAGLRHLFYRNPGEPRPPVDRSRWAHLLEAER